MIHGKTHDHNLPQCQILRNLVGQDSFDSLADLIHQHLDDEIPFLVQDLEADLAQSDVVLGHDPDLNRRTHAKPRILERDAHSRSSGVDHTNRHGSGRTNVGLSVHRERLDDSERIGDGYRDGEVECGGEVGKDFELTSNLCLHEGANSDRGDDGIHAYEPKGSNRHHDRVAGLDCGRGTQLRDLGTYGHRGEEMRPLTAPEGHNEKRRREKRPPRPSPTSSHAHHALLHSSDILTLFALDLRGDKDHEVSLAGVFPHDPEEASQEGKIL